MSKLVSDERLEELAGGYGRSCECYRCQDTASALRELQRRRAEDAQVEQAYADTETLRRDLAEARATIEGVRAACGKAVADPCSGCPLEQVEKCDPWPPGAPCTAYLRAEDILALLSSPAPAAPALFCDVDPSIRVGIRDWILDALEGDDTFEGMCVRDWLNGLRVIDPDAHAPAEAAALDLGTLTVQTTLTPELAKLLYPAAVETAKEDESDE